MKKIFLMLVFVLISCNKQNPKAKETAFPKNEKMVTKIDIHKCTTVKDTLFKDGDWIKYVYIKDNQYGLEVKFKGEIDTLKYYFNCNTHNGLIPKIVLKNDKLILNQGIGFTYRNVILYDKFQTLEFETERGVGFEGNDYLVFKENEKLCLFDRDSKKIMFKDIPKQYKDLKIIKSSIFKTKVVVYFEKNKTFDIKI